MACNALPYKIPALREAHLNVISLAHQLRQGTIDRIAETSDVELGLRALLGNSPITRR
jgi:hypothetical protein